MSKTQLSETSTSAAAATLAARLDGSCHLPGDPAYEACCTIWNAMI